MNLVEKRNYKRGDNKKAKMLKKACVGIGITCVLLTGCQKTPEESAVVSKAGGLSENVIAKPLEEGETRENDIPAHWKMEEFRNKNRMLLSADLDLDEHKLGNLPVIEMKNHVLTEEELKELVEYFAEGETLYECQPYTKDVYEEVISRIENKEGIYASSYPWLKRLTIRQCAEAGIEFAPEKPAIQEKEKIEFTTRFVDEGYEKALICMKTERKRFGLKPMQEVSELKGKDVSKQKLMIRRLETAVHLAGQPDWKVTLI